MNFRSWGVTEDAACQWQTLNPPKPPRYSGLELLPTVLDMLMEEVPQLSLEVRFASFRRRLAAAIAKRRAFA
jgi:hypothetical protein